MKTIFAHIGVLLFLVQAGCDFSQEVEPNLSPYTPDETGKKTIATVNGVPVPASLFHREIQLRGGHIPGRFETVEEKENLLNEVLHFELVAQEAEKLNYHQDPEIVHAYKKLLVSKYRREIVNDEIEGLTITQQEIEDYYQNHRHRYKIPAMARAALIFLKTGGDRQNRKRQQTARLVRQLAVKQAQKERSFGSLAKEYSDDLKTKFKGGALSWISPSSQIYDLAPEVVNAVFNLKEPGAISPWIETERGIYLLKLMELQPARLRPIEAVRIQIETDLQANKRREWLARFYRKLKERATIEIDRGMLTSIQWQSPVSPDKSTVPSFPEAE